MVRNSWSRRRTALGACLLPLVLAACGGGDEGSPPAPGSCTLQEHKTWLGNYMNNWYFWYRLSPRPDASVYTDVQDYFDALLYTGSSADFPSDRYSGSQATESFNRFYGDGATLGYGVSVAALELDRNGSLPLHVRHVEPLSPAARAGVQRGDRVLTINGRPVSELIVAEDFAALTPAEVGNSLVLTLSRAGTERSVTLLAEVFTLRPVSEATVTTTAGGRRIGYLAVKDMISQAEAPLETAFARFRAEAVRDLVLDLRYNGGGLVSTGATLASYVAGSRGAGLNYASLLYNDKRASNNQSYAFTSRLSALNLPRVFVLMGRRTCSASEQLINGLRGAGVEVVAIGETSCGKPVGSLPTSACGRTYSVINFESVNQRSEGRYFDGFAPTCEVAEDFTAAAGSSADPLMAAARTAADTGVCPATAALSDGRAGALSAQAVRRRSGAGTHLFAEGDAGVGQGMLPR
ncbi:MAG: S41 family peptidase [Rubrivivax sp.]|nr:S41 family peptidase [Rubrivivax sp.]